MADDIIQNIKIGGVDQVLTDLQKLAQTGQAAFQKLADAADRLSKIKFEQVDNLKSSLDDVSRSADKASSSFKDLGESGTKAGKEVAGVWDGVGGSIAKAGLVINGVKSILDLIPGVVSNAAKEIAKLSTPADIHLQKLKDQLAITTASINPSLQSRKAELQSTNDELAVESALDRYRKVKADRQSTSLEKRQAEAALDAAELRQEENQRLAFVNRKKLEFELIEARKKANDDIEKSLGKHREDAKRPYSSEEKRNLKDYTEATEELGKAWTYLQTKVGALLAPTYTAKAKWLSSLVDDSAKLLTDITAILKKKDELSPVSHEVVSELIPPGTVAPSKFDQIFDKLEAFGKKQGSDTLVTAIKVAKEVSLDLVKVWEGALLPAAKGLGEALDSLTETFNKTFGTDFSKSGLLVLGVVTSLIGGFASLGIAVAAVFSSAHTPDLDNFRKKLGEVGFDVEYIKRKFSEAKDYISDLFSGKKDSGGKTPFDNLKSGLKDFGVDFDKIKKDVEEFVTGDKGLKSLFSGTDESGQKISGFQSLLKVIKEFPVASGIAAAALIKITGAGASLEQVLIGTAAALNIVSNLVGVIANFPLTALIAGFVLLIAYGGDFSKILSALEKAFNGLASVFNAFTENLSKLTGFDFLKTAITGIDVLKAALIGLAAVVVTRVVPAIFAAFATLAKNPGLLLLGSIAALASQYLLKDLSFPEKTDQYGNIVTPKKVSQYTRTSEDKQGTSLTGEKFDYSKEKDPIKRYFENLASYWETSLNSIVKAFDNFSDRIAKSVIDGIDSTIDAIKTRWQALVDWIFSFLPGSGKKETTEGGNTTEEKEVTPRDLNKKLNDLIEKRRGKGGVTSDDGGGSDLSTKLVGGSGPVVDAIVSEKTSNTSGFDNVVNAVNSIVNFFKQKDVDEKKKQEENNKKGEDKKKEESKITINYNNTINVGVGAGTPGTGIPGGEIAPGTGIPGGELSRDAGYDDIGARIGNVTPSRNIEDRRPRDSRGNIIETPPEYYDKYWGKRSDLSGATKLAGPYPQSDSNVNQAIKVIPVDTSGNPIYSGKDSPIYSGNSVKNEAIFTGRNKEFDDQTSRRTITSEQYNRQKPGDGGYSGGIIEGYTKIFKNDTAERNIEAIRKNFNLGPWLGTGTGGAPNNGLGSGGPAPWSGGGLGSGGKNPWQASGLEEGLSQLSGKIAAVSDKFGSLDGIFGGISSAAEQIDSAFERVGSAAEEAAGEFKQASSSAGSAEAAGGGFVSGPGHGTSDSIPARLSNGEFVVRASAVKNVGVGFLHAINNFADGGFVSNLSNRMGSLLPRFATGGPVGAIAGHSGGLHPVTINFGGHTVGGLLAPRNVVQEMRAAAVSTQVSSTGRKPSHYR